MPEPAGPIYSACRMVCYQLGPNEEEGVLACPWSRGGRIRPFPSPAECTPQSGLPWTGWFYPEQTLPQAGPEEMVAPVGRPGTVKPSICGAAPGLTS